jgi:isoleucyl-tRNA synthetase
MQRISEVFDCWVESGSMSFAQHHYPFENKEKFESTLPAQFISEYISQTRAWFYVMHVMSVALFEKNSYENVVTTGVILNEKGEKMSKSKKNYPDPWEMINEFGVDALRLYLMNSTVMHAENLYFNERDLRDIFRKHIMILWNVFKFYDMFAPVPRQVIERPESEQALDKWIMSRLSELISEVTTRMDHYDMPRATRPLTDFIDELSTWFVRRSRDRFKGDDEADKELGLATLGFVLQELSKIMAPFTPFLSEGIWQKVTGYDFRDMDKSVHLEEWPEAGTVDKLVLSEMAATRKIVEMGLKARDEAGIKVRQPLRELLVTAPKTVAIKNKYIELIKAEVNVKEVNFKGNAKDIKVQLNTQIDDELRQEGLKREIVRLVNALR